MRWPARRKRHWSPWFAFLPLRDGGAGKWVWLEPIWTRFCGEYTAWRPWEDRPNDRCIVCDEWLQTGPRGDFDCPACNPDPARG